MNQILTFLSSFSEQSETETPVIDPQRHILEFPAEILFEIFQHVPNKMMLKLVCKVFNKICLMKGCRLIIDEVRFSVFPKSF